MTTQETPEPGTEAGRRLCIHMTEWAPGDEPNGFVDAVLAIEAEAREAAAFQAVRDVAASREVIAAEARAAVLAEVRAKVEVMPEPTLGLKGGVNRAAVLALLDTLSDGGPTDG